ncbi:Por secretion system C-terminal sorting domain-containing protein [Mesonia phycicola]|uniref:Por secretion system C-terminal sorting domain-containing protein n=1 Tax=Mesonia phycicola TaxID=579105 RepID=A0A1M6FAN2_9FLAO|nr:choice-of-anchor D domain-containing protein [Mesonia phycicola]SHI94733.1 Por secretion system C-terminal sorting domain-containing protein [Mesonia phycicola]
MKKITLMLMMLISAYSFSQSYTLDIPIASSTTGSGEEDISSGEVSTSSSDLEFYHDGSTEQMVGVQFETVNVPQGSTITNAYIQFQADQEGGGDVTVNIVGQDIDNAPSIQHNVYYDISSRTATTANEDWIIASWIGEKDMATVNQRTSDISSIVSEITSRSGWVNGNNIAFMITGVSRANLPAWREAESGGGAGGPILHIEYVNSPTEIEITGNNTSITNGSTIADVLNDTQFGGVGVGQTFTKTFTIKNVGGEDLVLSGSTLVSITGDSQFSILTQPNLSTLSAGETTDFVVQFTPTATATVYNATISIANNDADENPFTFAIEGSGETSVIDLDVLGNSTSITNNDSTPDVLDNTDFGTIYSVVERTRTFTIENTGNSLLNITSVASSNPDFAIVIPPSSTLNIGETTTFDIAFTPSSVATISSTITIVSDDTDENPFTFTVEGESTNPTLPSSISAGDDWYYLDNGSDQGTAWRNLNFDQDNNWTSATTEIGYGDGDETTDLGQPVNPKPITTYFRKYINIADITAYNSIDLEAVRDDGIIVYINNVEVWRDNLPIGETIEYNDVALVAIADTDESAWNTKNLSSSSLVNGINVITVEIHQNSNTSSDISFNFKLTPSTAIAPSAYIERGPYLQSGTPTSVVVKWRTDTATESVVNYGTSLSSLTLSETDANLTTEHEVTLTSLTPNTKYYFNIGNQTEVLSESTTGDMYVITAPTAGTDQFVRAWILGDPGTASTNQRNVRDAYYNYVDNSTINTGKTDMMLFLGDNAYNSGTDTEYQYSMFDIYDEMLKKSVAWSCLGNHDGYTAFSATQSGPYYDIFTFPTAGESGGTASGTEAYYSFDYANIHFIVLDSYDSSRDVGSTMYNWAQTDIQNTTQDWIVAIFHHPAYTKGSHDSDSEDRLINMRENFMPMLESNGVDLVLSGHSHSYERSYFLNGHNGYANTFDINEISNGGHTVGTTGSGDGRADGNGVYQKDANQTEGAVYITTGSAGKISGGDLNHQAMYLSLNELGSSVMEVESDGTGGQNLNIKFITDTGAINDYFTINKTGITLSVDDNDLVEKTIKLFPVPANDLLNVEVDASEQLQKVIFYSNTGQLVKESTNKTINVSNMKTGVYVVEITTDQNTYYKSIIIE